MSAIRTTLKAILPRLDKALENLGTQLSLHREGSTRDQLLSHFQQLNRLKALSAFDSPLLDSDLYLSAEDADLMDTFG
jgi:hypothetical protein